MENASKALIIAGAILISILIISFGVIILGQGGDVINNANMSDAEITAFNGKFEAYAGTTTRGSNVKQLLKTVANHDRTETDDSKKVVVMWEATRSKLDTLATQMEDSTFSTLVGNLVQSSGEDGTVKPDGKNTGAAGIGSGSVYTVKCVYSKNSGLVRAIYIAKN